ncbi:hypothetical protein [Bradyrhizobium sp. SZCCHNS3052]|uniref:hypothetical protein n=1 Tax=Bradyrhizobium sp. SZCCHNS3052 TaxID=3057321 RepID=UPI002916D410|nr:hypothetical protein [Bradyrhizobium sp. SZCCHNS3052]
MKALKRQRAERQGNNAIRWVPSPTTPGEPLDGLFAHNVREREALLSALHFTEKL